MNARRSFITLFVFTLMGITILGQITLAQSPLTLTDVTPENVVAEQPTTVTLTGSGFDENTVIQWGGLVSDDVAFIDATTLQTRFPVNLSAGVYSVSVKNTDGSIATLENAVTVERPVSTPALTITHTEPQRVTNGRENTLTILGSGYTTGAVVRLVGFGVLETTVLHGSALTAVIPATIPEGRYKVEVSDIAGNVAQSPENLRVVAPVVATTTPEPLPTPIKISTTPSLGVSSFTANPSTIMPGQSTVLSFTVNNYGNQAARSVSVALGSGSKFVVSGGLASITMPDLGMGASYSANLTVTAVQDVTAGVTSIPIKLSYRDDLGEVYTSDAELSVTISSSAVQSQIMIDAYTVEPEIVEPGLPVTLRMTLVNNGNVLASQVKLQITGADSVLLPNGSGDTFFVGDLTAGAKSPLQVPLLVSMGAKAGPQMQPISLTFYQNGEAKEVSTSITLNVAEVNKAQPLLILTGYETSEEILVPGSRFDLDVTLQNVGTLESRSTTVTFGTVQSSGGGTGNPNNPDGGGGSQTNTTPSTTFAPLGTAGLTFIGEIGADATAEISQAFIVSGDVNSGIYTLPITLQYVLPDGSNKQESMNLSLVVIVPPRIQINPANPVPEMLTAGEPMPVSLEIANSGRSRIDFTEATVTATNAEILDGQAIPMETVSANDSLSIMTVVMPLEEGQLDLNISLGYINDLGQPDRIELAYTAQVMPPPPVFEEPVFEEPVEPVTEPEPNWLGRFIMAALGLGS